MIFFWEEGSRVGAGGVGAVDGGQDLWAGGREGGFGMILGFEVFV